jgi:hypothetical protein
VFGLPLTIPCVLQVGTYDYAGCMTVPRLLHLDGDRLHQSPAPELLALRRGESWQCGHISLGPETSVAVPGVVGSNFLDIEVGGVFGVRERGLGAGQREWWFVRDGDWIMDGGGCAWCLGQQLPGR